MKEQKNSEFEWIIFGVLAVVIPVIFAFIISSIVNNKIVSLADMIDSIIIVGFSVSCSLLSICWNVNKQKSDKLTKWCFVFSGGAMFISWTVYIFSLVKSDTLLVVILIISLIIVIICSLLGISLSKRSDENKNETIKSMHNNCAIIRKQLIKDQCDKELQSHVIREYDLLCNPDEFDRVEAVLKNLNMRNKK